VEGKSSGSYSELEQYFLDHAGDQVKIKARRLKGGDVDLTLKVPRTK
jgi:hypothetical protein